MEINYLNLKRMFNHVLENVPEEKIQMSFFRNTDYKSHECKSAGCIVGHCTILDNFYIIPKHENGDINFEKWSHLFTGIYPSLKWSWLFSSFWPDNKEQILLRLKYLIDNQSVPEKWHLKYSYKLPVEKLELYKI